MSLIFCHSRTCMWCTFCLALYCRRFFSKSKSFVKNTSFPDTCCFTKLEIMPSALCCLAANQPNHRLNGSSSSVLTATSLSYGKAKNSTPHRIKTPDPIKIKFGTVDYVGKETRHAKFYANPPKGGFPANG